MANKTKVFLSVGGWMESTAVLNALEKSKTFPSAENRNVFIDYPAHSLVTTPTAVLVFS
jgi:GH18 family chitinase